VTSVTPVTPVTSVTSVTPVTSVTSVTPVTPVTSVKILLMDLCVLILNLIKKIFQNIGFLIRKLQKRNGIIVIVWEKV